AVFCAGVIVGTLYMITVQSTGQGVFYTSDTIVHQRSHILSLVFPYGTFFGMTLALLYGIFRLGMGRFLSIVFTLALLVSPLHLNNLVPWIWRDYAKAPLILAIVLAMGLLVRLPVDRTRVAGLSAAAGI